MILRFFSAVFVNVLLAVGVFAQAVPRDSFRSGELWPDDKGVHINAHGGGLLVVGDVTYWFGEHKIGGEAGNRAQVGVRVYSSKDLYNWKDEGIALPVSDDPKSEIAKDCIIERPKVIFNAKTGKYVMWFHLEFRGQGYHTARAAVAVADKPTGPYTYLHSLRINPRIWPVNTPEALRQPLSEKERAFARLHHGKQLEKLTYAEIADLALRRDYTTGQMSRDMTLFVDDDGSAYHIASSEENLTLHISRLNADFTGFDGRYVRVLAGEMNEAPAVFKRRGKYYLLASGCTGWKPNPARMAVADKITGPWTPLGNPCVGVNPGTKLGPEKTFGGQSTYVLPVPGREDAFIALFDEWRPKNHIDGRYYWLPIRFDGERPVIEWNSNWDLSVFNR
jgi:hypothetical protein